MLSRYFIVDNRYLKSYIQQNWALQTKRWVCCIACKMSLGMPTFRAASGHADTVSSTCSIASVTIRVQLLGRVLSGLVNWSSRAGAVCSCSASWRMPRGWADALRRTGRDSPSAPRRATAVSWPSSMVPCRSPRSWWWTRRRPMQMPVHFASYYWWCAALSSCCRFASSARRLSLRRCPYLCFLGFDTAKVQITFEFPNLIATFYSWR